MFRNIVAALGLGALAFTSAYAQPVDSRNAVIPGGTGLTVGTPTGGPLGPGTINATGVYVNGVATGGSLAVPNAPLIGGNGTTLAPVNLGANLSVTAGTLNSTIPTATTSALGGVKPDGVTINVNGSGVISAVGGSAASVTVGTTTVGGGTPGYLLYDAAGLLGNLATTGTGSAVLGTSPTLVTPALGTPSALILTNASGLPATGLTGTLQAAQEPAHTGDVTNAAGSLALSLATVNANVGSFTCANITANAKGLVTAATSNCPTFPASGDIVVSAGPASNPTGIVPGTGVSAALAAATNGANGLPILGTGGLLSASQIPIATTSTPGGIKPDGTLMTVNGTSGLAAFPGLLPLTGGTLTGGLTTVGITDSGGINTTNSLKVNGTAVGFGLPGFSANIGSGGQTSLTDGTATVQFKFTSPSFNGADDDLTFITSNSQNTIAAQTWSPTGYSALILRDMFNNEVGAFHADNSLSGVVMGYASGTTLTVTSVLYTGVPQYGTVGALTGTPGPAQQTGSYALTASTAGVYVLTYGTSGTTGTGQTGTYALSGSITLYSSSSPGQIAIVGGGSGLEISCLSNLSCGAAPTFNLRQTYQPGGVLTFINDMEFDPFGNMRFSLGGCSGLNSNDVVDVGRGNLSNGMYPGLGICSGMPPSGVTFLNPAGSALFSRSQSYNSGDAAVADVYLGGTTSKPTTLRFATPATQKIDIVQAYSPNRLRVSTTDQGLFPLDIYADNTGAVQFNATERHAGVVRTTPTTGSTVTFGNTESLAIVDPAGTLAALTITLPACASTNDGDTRRVAFNQTITALTVGTASGTIGNGFPSTIVAGGPFSAHCLGSNATWYFGDF